MKTNYARRAAIWFLYWGGAMTYAELASAFDISRDRIRRIVGDVDRAVERARLRATVPATDPLVRRLVAAGALDIRPRDHLHPSPHRTPWWEVELPP